MNTNSAPYHHNVTSIRPFTGHIDIYYWLLAHEDSEAAGLNIRILLFCSSIRAVLIMTNIEYLPEVNM